MWAEYADVESRWVGGDVPATETQVTTLIQDAEDTVLRAFPDIQERIDDASLPEDRVVKVVARMVIRHLRNPNGTRSISQGSGPYQQSITYGGNDPGSMWLTDEDRNELSPASQQTGKAFTVNTTPYPYEVFQPADDALWRPIT